MTTNTTSKKTLAKKAAAKAAAVAKPKTATEKKAAAKKALGAASLEWARKNKDRAAGSAKASVKSGAQAGITAALAAPPKRTAPATTATAITERLKNHKRTPPGKARTKDGREFLGNSLALIPQTADELKAMGLEVLTAEYIGGKRPTGRFIEWVVLG